MTFAQAREFAPAKINLTLHVTGQRADGYHLLDSLVVFAKIGDWVTAAPAAITGLTIVGPQAAGLVAETDNLVLRAAQIMGGAAELTLEKHLPIASGIGGGSADAAATLRLLARAFERPLPATEQVLKLGADVPVCLQEKAVRMQGVGERLSPIGPMAQCWMVLVNPGVGVSTPAIFKGLSRKDNPPMPQDMPDLAIFDELCRFLAAQRNDLEAPAITEAPVIAEVKAALAAQQGCGLARMSGSGATCFGLFESEDAAAQAACAVQARHPNWWVAAGQMIS